MTIRLALLIAVLSTALGVNVSASAQDEAGFSISFSVADLGSIEHPDQANCADRSPGATVTAIAAGNRAVGSVYDDDERAVAALFSAGGVRKMESGPGGGVANAINSKNIIAGAIFKRLPDEPCGNPTGARPAIWDEDYELSTFDLPEGAGSGVAMAINSDGVVAGWVRTDAGRRAALWRGDDILVISHAGIEGVDAIQSEASDINDAGIVSGTLRWSDGDDVRERPFVWDGVTVQYLDPTLNQNGVAHAISDDGTVAGAVTGTDGFEQATLWWQGQLVDLGNLPDRPASAAIDINSGGVVVGYGAREDGLSRATIWIDGAVIDLNEIIPQDLGWQLQYAAGINDDGSIVGWGDLDGERRAFLLAPAAG